MPVKRTDPWYIHLILYIIIAILVFILVEVAIIQPQQIVEKENYFKTEARLRMNNLKEAEILYQKKYGRFCGNLDTLIAFIKNDPYVDSIMNTFDSSSMRPLNPFSPLSHGKFEPDSLFLSPKTHQRFVLEVDSTKTLDTVVTPRGKVLRVDTNVHIGTLYRIEDPSGYGTIGDLQNTALKNTASWE